MTIWQDLRLTCRSLLRSPAFALAAVITLALGIGANTAIFSVIENVLLKPLPYTDPARLVQVSNTYPPTLPQTPNSAGDFRDFQKRAQTFAAMGAYIDTPRGLNLTGEGDPARVEMRYVTSGLFPLLGIQPIAGRNFTPDEDLPGPQTVLISHQLWQSRFASDPAVVGRTVTLDGRGYSLVGVLPETLQLAPTTGVWLPIGQYGAGPDPYRYHEFNVIGRLKPGVRIEQAQAELTTLNQQEVQALPDTHKNFGVSVTTLQAPSATTMRTPLIVLFGAVILVLFIACANFINLLMARYAYRQRELAIRVALGASRYRLLRQILTESMLLCFVAGVVGVFLAAFGLQLLGMLAPSDIAILKQTELNIPVLSFTLAISLLCGVLCGVIPAFRSSAADVESSLRAGVRSTDGVGRQTLRQVLIVSEIALAIVPLMGASLLIRSFHRLMEVDPGFRHDRILTFEVDKPEPTPAEEAQISNTERIASLKRESREYDQLMLRIQSLPGVQAAGGISVLPLGTAMRSASRFLVEGLPTPADGVRPVAETRSVSPGYFATMGIPLRMGRLLDEHDYASQNIMVDEALAQKFWPGGDAIGKRINFCSLAPEPCWVTIVGVVGNVHQYGLEAGATFDTYGVVGWLRYTVVRTSSDPVALAHAVIDAVHTYAPTLPVTQVTTLDNILSESVSPRRFSTILLGVFAGLALLLACVGVYAVMSYAVRLRTNEIGVRLALGATPVNVWSLILGGGARLVLAGIVIGSAGALALTRIISSLLFGITATDPATLVGVPLLLGAIGLLACYIPARQAMRVDPIIALRQE